MPFITTAGLEKLLVENFMLNMNVFLTPGLPHSLFTFSSYVC